MQKAVGYFRVSTDEQVEGYSIAAQERAYHNYCTLHHLKPAHQYRDEGKSARTDSITRRPQFAKMLHDAQAGQFNVIIVHKMDRFSRSMKVAVQAFEHLGKHNIGLISISEPNIDYSTPQGKLFMHMLWALAQFYSDNLAQEVKKGLCERRKQGMYNGTLPFGLAKDEQGIPKPDLATRENGSNNYQALLLIFHRAAELRSSQTIADELNELGYLTTGTRGRNAFSKSTVLTIIANRFYLGELPDGDYPPGQSRRGRYTQGHKGKHASVISQELWEAAQLTLVYNRKPYQRCETHAQK